MATGLTCLEVRENAVLTAITRVVMVIEYDGRRYCGFQLQANGPTIQGQVYMAVYTK